MEIRATTYLDSTLVVGVKSEECNYLVFYDYDHNSTPFSTRKQIYDGFQIFHRMESSFSSNSLKLKDFKAFVEEYREILKIKVDEADSEQCQNDESNQMLLIWDLWDIIFYTEENELIIPTLQLWLKFNHYKTTKHAFNKIKSHVAQNLTTYWTIVKRFVCIGRMEDAANALSHHPDYHANQTGFKFIEEILINWPEYDNLFSNDTEQWHSKYLLFQKKLENFITKNSPIDSDIQDIILILLGRIMDINRDTFIMTSLFELFLVKMIFSTPTIKLYEFHRDSYKYMSMVATKFKLQSKLDAVYENIIARNIPLLHEALLNTFNHLWFQCHLWDCFYKFTGITNKYSSQTGDQIREKSVYRYASILFQHDMWEIGTHYMMTCPSYNSHHLVLCLSRTRFHGECEMLKMLRLKKQLKINDPESDLTRILIYYYIRAQKPCDALLLSLDSSDRYYVNFITNMLIDIFICKNIVLLQDIYGIVLSRNIDNPNLIFYCHLSEFYHLISFDYKKGIDKLFFIFSSTLIPNRAYGQLVHVAIPAVLDKRKYLDQEQTIKLMEMFNMWENSPTKHLKMLNNQKIYDDTLQSRESIESKESSESELFIKSVLLNNLIP